jgi:hypothetical protein
MEVEVESVQSAFVNLIFMAERATTNKEPTASSARRFSIRKLLSLLVPFYAY